MTPELWEALLNGLKLEKSDIASIALAPVAFFGIYTIFYLIFN